MDDREELADLLRQISELEQHVNTLKGSTAAPSSQLIHASGELDMKLYSVERRTYLADPPPSALMHALRSRAEGPFQPVWVTVRHGLRMLALVDGKGADPDETTEVAAWKWLQANLHPQPGSCTDVDRVPMPDRLVGAARENGNILLSTGLCGSLVATAYQGLRMSLRTAKLRSLVLLPVLAGWRSFRQLIAQSPVAGLASSAGTAVAVPCVMAATITQASGPTSLHLGDLEPKGRIIELAAAESPLSWLGSDGRPDRPKRHPPAPKPPAQEGDAEPLPANPAARVPAAPPEAGPHPQPPPSSPEPTPTPLQPPPERGPGPPPAPQEQPPEPGTDTPSPEPETPPTESAPGEVTDPADEIAPEAGLDQLPALPSGSGVDQPPAADPAPDPAGTAQEPPPHLTPDP